MGYHIPTKWISEDGKTFWVVFSSESYLDRFNIVKAMLVENPSGEELEQNTPHNFSLEQNFPNPFNPQTYIRYSTAEYGTVKINIYNLNGELIRSPVNKVQQPGSHIVIWDGKNFNGQDVASGIYFYELVFIGTKSGSIRKKMLLLK